jgi:hypothetical protein
MLAVQFADILFFLLVPLGVESLHTDRAAKGFLALKLTHMPFSHSMIMTVLYGVFCVCCGLLSGRQRLGFAIALAILSHWILDLVVHTPDLPLGFGARKIGLGLWYYPFVAFVLEIAFLVIAALIVSPLFKTSKKRWWALVLSLIGIQAITTFAFPFPDSAFAISTLSQVTYFSIALLTYLGLRGM